MKFEDWLRWAERYREANPQLRKGQAFFNSLGEWKPALAASLTATDLDCFHDDSRLGIFLDVVRERWSDVNDLTLKPYAREADSTKRGIKAFDLLAPAQVLAQHYQALKVPLVRTGRDEAAHQAAKKHMEALVQATAEATRAWEMVWQDWAGNPAAEAVLNLHRPEKGWDRVQCTECMSDEDYEATAQTWPCPTYVLVAEASGCRPNSRSEQLPDEELEGQPLHRYLSTACWHGFEPGTALHARCRVTCKFCGEHCYCSCHT